MGGGGGKNKERGGFPPVKKVFFFPLNILGGFSVKAAPLPKEKPFKKKNGFYTPEKKGVWPKKKKKINQ